MTHSCLCSPKFYLAAETLPSIPHTFQGFVYHSHHRHYNPQLYALDEISLSSTPKVRMQPCNTATNCLDIYSPYVTVLHYYTFSYNSKKLICTCSHSSAHANVTIFKGGNFKHFKIPVDPQGNRHFATVTQFDIRTSDSR